MADEYRYFPVVGEVEVSVRYGPMPEAPADVAYVFTYVPAAPPEGQEWSEKEVLTALDDLLRGEGGYRTSYDLNVRKNHFSWGAEGINAFIELYIATPAADALIGALTLGAIQKVYQRMTVSDRDTEPRAYQEWAGHARYRVASQFPHVEPDSLQLIGDAELFDPTGWQFTFIDPHGVVYIVKLLDQNGGYLTSIERQAPGGSALENR